MLQASRQYVIVCIHVVARLKGLKAYIRKKKKMNGLCNKTCGRTKIMYLISFVVIMKNEVYILLTLTAFLLPIILRFG